ncbi:MAG: DMT family transporter, partial [Verrucomicrobiota bacterium]
MDTRKAMDGRAVVLMVLLSLTWGLQQVILKATASHVAPLLQIAIRSGVGAVLVGLLVFGRAERVSLGDGTWRPGLVAGFLFALEFLFIGEGLRHTSASHLVVFLYTAPIFASLGLHWKLPTERLRALQWVGIFLAFGGILLAFLGPAQPAAGGDVSKILWGDFLALLAGASWGVTTVVVRCSRLARVSATQTLLYQLVVAFILLTLAAMGSGQMRFDPTPAVWGSLVFQSLAVAFGSLLIWFWLLRHYKASQLGVFSFMTPFFGIGFG